MAELFHSQGHCFELYHDLRDKIRSLGYRWNKRISPALVCLAKESGYPGYPESTDNLNGMILYCGCS